MQRISLKYRIAIAIFLMESVMVGVMLWTTLSNSFHASDSKQKAHDEAVIRPLMELGRIALLNDEYSDLQTYISFVPKTDGALHVILTNADNTIVASSDIFELGKPQSKLVNSGELYWSTRRIADEAGILGHMSVQFSNANLHSSKTTALFLGIGVALIGMTFIAMVGIMMGALLTRRLEKLRDMAHSVAKGDFDCIADIQGNDEIAELGHTFNTMAVLLNDHIHEIEENHERFSLAVSGSSDGIWDWNVEQNLVYYSPTFKQILGYADDDAEFRDDIWNWKDKIHPDDFPVVIGALLDYLEGNSSYFVCEHRIRKKSGEYMWGLMRARGHFNQEEEPTRLAGSLTDITERKQFEQKIHHQALHDTLTSLPNRALLEDRLSTALSGAARNNSQVTVLMMDLDRFKEINDTLGHPVGDTLLIEVATRMRTVIRGTDTLARFGGDELVMVLPKTNMKQAMVVISKIMSAFHEHFHIDGKDLVVQCSIGGAVFPEDGGDAETLIKRADVAMYAAKKARLGYSFYDMNSDQHSPDRLSLISELHHAIHHDELVLFYQPKLDLKSGRLHSVEALVRWQHPRRGTVPPDQFIPLAEECGLIIPLTFWVLENALRQHTAWRQLGLEIPVAINLSTRNIHDLAFPKRIQQCLHEWKCEPRWLELEITESAVIDDPARAMAVLNQLDELGVQLSIDDFGTGYSSLSYLKNLPVDEVKIDRSFILDMEKDSKSAAIVQAMIALGHKLGLHVVAEGVENNQAMAIMESYGCDAIQGYYISKPLPAEQTLEVVKSWNASVDVIPQGRELTSGSK